MNKVKRTFTPGSEWVYFKIYAGSKTLDNILLKDISSVVTRLYRLKAIEKWFFIRYADPEPHIRVRFLVNDPKYVADIMIALDKQLNYLVNVNNIWKIQLDTYGRELERYGYNLMEEAESIFCKDSECILAILKLLRQFQNENYRWMIALKLIDSFFSDFSFNLQSKQRLIGKISNSFMAEFGFNKFNSKQFNSKFRDKRNIIESVLNDETKDEKFEKLLKIITKRSTQLTPVIEQLRIKLTKKGENSLDSLLTSYIHMTLNRLFMSKSRIHELILYDFMRRYYATELAKIKYSKK